MNEHLSNKEYINWLEYVIQTDEVVAELVKRLNNLQKDYDNLRRKVDEDLTDQQFRDII